MPFDVVLNLLLIFQGELDAASAEADGACAALRVDE